MDLVLVLYGFRACLYGYLQNNAMLLMKNVKNFTFACKKSMGNTQYFTTTDPYPFGYARRTL
jgi:hypothetical protein